MVSIIMAPASDTTNDSGGLEDCDRGRPGANTPTPGVVVHTHTTGTDTPYIINGVVSVSKGSPPPYSHAVYSMYPPGGGPVTTMASTGGTTDLQIASFTHPTPSTTSATFVGGTGVVTPGGGVVNSGGGGTTSFTNTFLRGILTSIDSKDPVVANAWLDTLLDAIDLLPPDVIKREIVAIAISKGHLSNNAASRLVHNNTTLTIRDMYLLT